MRPILLTFAACLLLLAGCTTPTPQPAEPTPVPDPADVGPEGGSTTEAPAPAKLLCKGKLATPEFTVLSTGGAQITLANKTSVTLDLYVDGKYGCRALKGLFCTVQTTPGTHTLKAKGSGGEANDSATVGAGQTFTWTVHE